MMNIGQLTDASGWSYMSQVPPKRPKPGDSCASPGSVAVRYDQPANLRFNDTIPGYACTQHSWVLNQHSQGLTDGIPFKCWLKHDTHLTQNERKRSTDSNYVFWYASCKSP
ncbi:hypothetical protein Pcinc_016002 [Petrolisthes cinctipes]|uniref:Uncharacterized protein n=1 Tax=Petrolisthes cinctipes TaxID=88211 RepID=A0AAE1KQ52_PETCI|nr:hypothetical protein Pcinc_016002 [Petrolisthes cinctipes]